ncbi:UDP-N-acetylglucosamine 2-epimerase (non-hydrolyzing) [Verrucomicrobia bacterium]|nr:UDP-N-acetylglucosamine 2-epimerase (non-hydrolyzing) [Verrucomicrobiota bacterium]
MPLIDIIAGARPNFMKIAPIIRAIKKSQSSGGKLGYRLVHTGQHYDERMSASFFKQLGIPDPDINLEVGSGTQAEQTAKIMMSYETLLLKKPSKLCLVVGDVTSTMACTIAAQKLCIPVAHVEAGIRSGDWSMPEEINRMVTDSITNYFFTTSQYANKNLQMSGFSNDRIFFVGNTMIDTLLHEMDRLSAPDCFESLGLEGDNYIVLTLHRPANVDAEQHLTKTLEAIMQHAGSLPVVFPVHPRTAKQLEHIHTAWDHLHCVEPMPYLQFNYLVKHAKAVITDSGGITEETTVMGIPCMTLRDSTERPETVDVGTNELIGTNPERIPPAMEWLLSGQWKKGAIPEKWDGKAAERIVEVLERCV